MLPGVVATISEETHGVEGGAARGEDVGEAAHWERSLGPSVESTISM